MKSRARLTGLSVDVDSIQSHLRGYGITDCSDRQSHYQRAIPRILEMFAKFEATATFFLIADEAKDFPDTIKGIISAGHEIGCHSMTHGLPFDLRDQARRHLEIHEAKKLLEDISGAPVIGFRAPSWDTTAELREALNQAGFMYDASSFPSWMMFLYRRQVERHAQLTTQTATPFSWSQCVALPYPHKISATGLIEIPVTTTPVFRLPYYHTLSYLLPRPIFSAVRAMAHLRRGPLVYTFHAADFLGLKEDTLDERFSRHPGMTQSLTYRLSRCGEELSHFSRAVPLRAIAKLV